MPRHPSCGFLSYNHQSNGQAEVCIKFVKGTVKKCFETTADIYGFIADKLLLLLTGSTVALQMGYPRYMEKWWVMHLVIIMGEVIK